MSKIRNIEVTYKCAETNMFFVTQHFSDWYDFADWLKQENLKDNDITIRSWRYKDKLI